MSNVIGEEVALVRRLMGNGGRWLLLANSYFIAAVSILVLVLVIQRVTSVDDFAPLRNENPQPLVGTAVVAPGGIIRNESVKCNDTDDAVAYDSRSYLQGVSDRTVRYVTAVADGLVRPPGCTEAVFNHEIPDDLPPGVYRYEGIEIARSSDNRTQIEPWFTETFEVTGR